MKYSGDKGSIYITVIIIIIILLMMLSMLMMITSRDVRTSDLYSAGIRASYLAHSGIAVGIAKAKSNPENDLSGSLDSAWGDLFPSIYPANHSLSWEVDYSEDNDDYTITSSGFYVYSQITVKRTLQVKVRIQDDLVEIDSWKQL